MIYDNTDVRRQDRLLERKRAEELLATTEYGILSMTDGKQPYGIPLNYVWDGKSAIYLHGATEGRKLRILAANPNISFCVIGRTHLIPEKFTTEYESVVLTGTAETELDDAEKWNALEMLLKKLSPDDMEKGKKYSLGSFSRVRIIKLNITRWSGKKKYMNPNAVPSYMKSQENG